MMHRNSCQMKMLLVLLATAFLLVSSSSSSGYSGLRRVLQASASEDGEPGNFEDSMDAVGADDNCMEVTLVGTGGGPIPFDGLAGSGTLVTYGPHSADCRGVNLQFDMGRANNNQLSKLGLQARAPPVRTPQNTLDAIFITHIHSDHVEDFGSYMLSRWHLLGQPIDVVCAEDAQVPIAGAADGATRTMSCTNFVEAIGDPYISSGEIDQRLAENPNRQPGGPADLANIQTFPRSGDPAVVWTSSDGNVTVQAISSNHVGGHASYRVDTPAGSVVIGGDASNDDQDFENRTTSTSAQVEMLLEGADILVHSTSHPVFGPNGQSTYPALFYNRQSSATDIGTMAQRVGVDSVMLTHLIPSIGAEVFNIWEVPGGALTGDDYIEAVREGGFTGDVFPGGDLTVNRLYA